MTNTYRVLLVDDEQTSSELVSDMLTNSREDQFTFDWRMGFDEASTAILSGDYDVCLLDYNLQGYTGIDLLRHVREQGSRLPIIMLTAHGSRAVDLGALEAGAAEYLDKSRLKPALLARTIRYAVKLQQDKNTLEDLYKQVQELEQLKTDMIRIAAHDLRTPLMTLLNYAKFLETDVDHPLQDYQQGYVGEIKASVRRMQHIIGDILSLERIQETAEERYQQTADLAEQIRIAAEAVFVAEQPQTVTIDVPEAVMVVQGDPAQLREAATNLMSNAVKYTPAGGTIHISLVTEDGAAVFKVQDTGYGIPDEMQERLFQPFYRAKSKQTRHIEGTGLGLYLVKNIVRRHGGELIFESIYGGGSTFGFRLPLLETVP